MGVGICIREQVSLNQLSLERERERETGNIPE